MIRDTLKISCFLISNYISHASTGKDNKTKLAAKCNDEEQVVYQTKNIENGIKQWDWCKTSFKQVQAAKNLVALNNGADVKCCMSILYC